MEIYARESEKEVLARIMKQDRSVFLAVYGRRRVGKTFLIQHFFQDKGIFFHVTGTPGEKLTRQLWSFAEVFGDVFKDGDPVPAPGTWQEAFSMLRKAISAVPGGRRIILFFDELPWLATRRSGFISALSYLWNRYLESNPHIILIVCGSAATWMINNVINERGGLHGRLTHQMCLNPFDLSDTEIYLRHRDIVLDRKQITEIYMAIGGVAKYLDMIPRGMSSAQVIQELFFSCDRVNLAGEFDRLFFSLFEKPDRHLKVIKVLAQHQKGLPAGTLVQEAKLQSGSVRNRVLRELVESGFIAATQEFGCKKKGMIYRLHDEFSIFCLKWQEEMRKVRSQPQRDWWLTMQRSPSWHAWAGFAFERICLTHVHQIMGRLGISGMNCRISGWRYRGKLPDDHGAQIDLVIDRPDRCINLCEIKFSEKEYVITKNCADLLRQRIEKFKEQTGTRKTVFLTLITCAGIAPNKHSLGLVNQQLTIDDLFRPAAR